jgi:hypothetical protein
MSIYSEYDNCPNAKSALYVLIERIKGMSDLDDFISYCDKYEQEKYERMQLISRTAEIASDATKVDPMTSTTSFPSEIILDEEIQKSDITTLEDECKGTFDNALGDIIICIGDEYKVPMPKCPNLQVVLAEYKVEGEDECDDDLDPYLCNSLDDEIDSLINAQHIQ